MYILCIFTVKALLCDQGVYLLRQLFYVHFVYIY